MIRVGVDTGGTFTDFVVLDGRRLTRFKLPSTPEDPSRAVLEGLARILGKAPSRVVHGTTVATNALLTRRGGRVCLLTTEGFEDVLEIGRQARPGLYELEPRVAPPLVPRALRLGVRERLDERGRVLQPLDKAELLRLVRRVRAARPEAVAVTLLHAHLHPVHERRLARALRRAGLEVSVSHELAPEVREYERTVTTVANAYVQPVVRAYLDRLGRKVPRGTDLWVMGSSGGLMRPARAAREPVRTLLSGPAGGVAAALRLGARAGFPRLLTFDMGGTSTDVALLDGEAEPSLERSLDGLPLRVPMLDIHTVGAGGGSYLYVDASGALRSGPESAGANPGPAAWGRGTRPTVTDAHLHLGNLWPETMLGPVAELDLATEALAGVGAPVGLSPEALARGGLEVADVVMEGALRRISVERGMDPRDFALVSFGGAGGLHAARLAARLGVRSVLVPLDAAAFSAWGLLVARARAERSRAWLAPLRSVRVAALREASRELEAACRRDLRLEGQSRGVRLTRRLDLRYLGQSFELSLPLGPNLETRFHAEHLRAFGVSDPGRAIELVQLRVSAAGPAPAAVFPGFERRPHLRRFQRPTRYFGRRVPVVPAAELGRGERLNGPAYVLSFATTVLVPESFRVRRIAAGAVLLESRP